MLYPTELQAQRGGRDGFNSTAARDDVGVSRPSHRQWLRRARAGPAETHQVVSQWRDVLGPNATFPAAAVDRHVRGRARPTLAAATIHQDPDVGHRRERRLQVPEQVPLRRGHDDEEPDAGKVRRRNVLQHAGGVSPTDPVRLGRIVDRFAFAHEARQTLAATPGAEDLHLWRRSRSRPARRTVTPERLPGARSGSRRGRLRSRRA